MLTGLRATRWVPVENITFSAAKIALLPVFLALTASHGVFLAWTVPVIVAIGAVNWYLFRKRIPTHQASNSSSENFPSGRELVSLAAGQYATGLVSTFSANIVALIVISRLGAAEEAYYYLPALISSGGVGVLLYNLVTSFLVEASTDPKELREHARVTIRAAIVVLVPSMTIGVAFAPLILRIFGAEYATHGTTLFECCCCHFQALRCQPSTIRWHGWTDVSGGWQRVSFSVRGLLCHSSRIIGHFGILAIGIASLVLSLLLTVLFLPISIRRYRMMTRSIDPQRDAPAQNLSARILVARGVISATKRSHPLPTPHVMSRARIQRTRAPAGEHRSAASSRFRWRHLAAVVVTSSTMSHVNTTTSCGSAGAVPQASKISILVPGSRRPCFSGERSTV